MRTDLATQIRSAKPLIHFETISFPFDFLVVLLFLFLFPIFVMLFYFNRFVSDCPIIAIQPFGVFVELCPGVEGLVHISELDLRRVRKTRCFLFSSLSLPFFSFLSRFQLWKALVILWDRRLMSKSLGKMKWANFGCPEELSCSERILEMINCSNNSPRRRNLLLFFQQ
jgi:hypothetical protein